MSLKLVTSREPITLQEIGSVNTNIGCIGRPQAGKTVKAVEILCSKAGSYPAFKFAVDPHGNLPLILPSGRHVDYIDHDSIDSMRKHFETRSAGIHRVPGCDPMDIVSFAVECVNSTAKLKGRVRVGVPAIILFDDIVAMRAGSPKQFDTAFLDLVTGRRNKHVEIIYTIQSPHLVHRQMLSLSTEIFLFNIIDEIDLRRLREVQIQPEHVSKVTTFLCNQYPCRNHPYADQAGHPTNEFVRCRLG